MSSIGRSYISFGRYSADLSLFFLVAECGQLSKAAQMAGLSQPRLSQRMKALEESIGQKLLIRGRRGIKLTRTGQALYNEVYPHVFSAADAFSRIREDPQRNNVMILSDIAFASFRLLPVFASLCDAFSDLNISLMTMQVPQPRSASDADIVIRMVGLHEVDETETCLFRESISIVCSPEYRRAHGPFEGPQDVLGKTLIGLSADGDAPWLTWAHWFNSVGLDGDNHHDVIRFNSYDHVIRSAVEGLGLTLGWKGLVDDHCDRGLLVQALPESLSSDMGYYMKISTDNRNDNARKVFDWISQNIY